ncbi:unnamed protein product [Scytosiphon promiscuus]
MAPQRQQQQPQQRSKRAIAASLVRLPMFVALLSSSVKTASGATSGSYFASCSSETLACEEDANCNACLSTWPVTDSLAICEEYPAETTTSDAMCEELGAMNCCGFATGTAEICMEDPLLEAFWTCTLDDIGCELVDMPCSTAGVAAVGDDDVGEAEEAIGEDSAASPVGHASSLLLSAAGAGLVATVVAAASASFSFPQ